jgi:Polysaccharide lyase
VSHFIHSKEDSMMSKRFVIGTLLVAQSAFAAPEWSALFEKSDLSEWNDYKINMNRWTFADCAMPDEGAVCARSELRSGDVPTFSTAQFRNDVTHTVTNTATAAFDGSERYYGWSMRLPASTATIGMVPGVDYQVMFWESDDPVYQQAMSLYIRATEAAGVVTYTATLYTRPQNGQNSQVWTAVLPTGQWHKFALRMKWSKDAQVGAMDLYFNGTKVVDNVKWPNIHVSSGLPLAMVWHHGIFTSSNPTYQKYAVTYLDNIRAGTALSDVMASAPPDAGAGGGTAAGGGAAGGGVAGSGGGMAGGGSAGGDPATGGGSSGAGGGTAQAGGSAQAGGTAAAGGSSTTGGGNASTDGGVVKLRDPQGCGCSMPSSSLAPLLLSFALGNFLARRRR